MTKYKSSDFREPLKWMEGQIKLVKYDQSMTDTVRAERMNILLTLYNGALNWANHLIDEEKERERLAKLERFNIRNGIKEVIE